MISRSPRQIVGMFADKTKTAEQFEEMVNSVPPANRYCTDGNLTYLDVVFPGKHKRNDRDKGDTHNVESINADLRHYIAGLARRSRCFFRTIETLRRVLEVFAEAFNRFGEAKMQTRKPVIHHSTRKHLHQWRYPAFSLLDFIDFG